VNHSGLMSFPDHLREAQKSVGSAMHYWLLGMARESVGEAHTSLSETRCSLVHEGKADTLFPTLENKNFGSL
jgi:hypothetical protein